jgi:host factor-I protein
MENKPAAQNIQDTFLNNARKERNSITIYLMSGVKLTGRIRSFDKYSVVLETSNQEQLIFKHAISTVAVAKAGHAYSERPRMVPAASATDTAGTDTDTDTGEAEAASGTEG